MQNVLSPLYDAEKDDVLTTVVIIMSWSVAQWSFKYHFRPNLISVLQRDVTHTENG